MTQLKLICSSKQGQVKILKQYLQLIVASGDQCACGLTDPAALANEGLDLAKNVNRNQQGEKQQ